MPVTPWSAPSIRPLGEAADARLGQQQFPDIDGYEYISIK